MKRISAALMALLATTVLGSAMPAPAASTELVILTMGDSITCGAPACGELDGYRAELDRLLTAAGQPHRWVVAAVGGVGCDYWAPRAAAVVAAEHPDVVLLDCGHNDGPTNFEAIYRTLLANILAASATVRVIPAWIMYSAIPPAPAWLATTQGSHNDDIYRVVGPLLAGGRVLPWADTGHQPLAYLDEGGAHPTVAGYAVMGRAWHQAMRGPYALPDIAPASCGLTGHRPTDPLPDYISCTGLATP